VKRRPVTVVSGPPNSGKTTWVNARRRPGDIVWDLDAVAATIAQSPRYPRPPRVIRTLYAMREALVSSLRSSDQPAYLIVSDEEEALAVTVQLKPRASRLVHLSRPTTEGPALA
jgi:hypothetical protein